eukprot:CAMPEP_0185177066 /NCGR_PEP_ID=MMETSP1139-20130426/29206_1 /TAXON_ID=298111 /ORGANISM="Pavlova sp., Strain CCMP459" /LENGTH=795 /DNA_ID=CAMNT_0027742853 /DNA_START=192 /DNA_END=2580 /DNA_ORIENTATION=-
MSSWWADVEVPTPREVRVVVQEYEERVEQLSVAQTPIPSANPSRRPSFQPRASLGTAASPIFTTPRDRDDSGTESPHSTRSLDVPGTPEPPHRGWPVDADHHGHFLPPGALRDVIAESEVATPTPGGAMGTGQSPDMDDGGMITPAPRHSFTPPHMAPGGGGGGRGPLGHHQDLLALPGLVSERERSQSLTQSPLHRPRATPPLPLLQIAGSAAAAQRANAASPETTTSPTSPTPHANDSPGGRNSPGGCSEVSGTSSSLACSAAALATAAASSSAAASGAGTARDPRGGAGGGPGDPSCGGVGSGGGGGGGKSKMHPAHSQSPLSSPLRFKGGLEGAEGASAASTMEIDMSNNPFLSPSLNRSLPDPDLGDSAATLAGFKPSPRSPIDSAADSPVLGASAAVLAGAGAPADARPKLVRAHTIPHVAVQMSAAAGGPAKGKKKEGGRKAVVAICVILMLMVTLSALVLVPSRLASHKGGSRHKGKPLVPWHDGFWDQGGGGDGGGGDASGGGRSAPDHSSGGDAGDGRHETRAQQHRRERAFRGTPWERDDERERTGPFLALSPEVERTVLHPPPPVAVHSSGGSARPAPRHAVRESPLGAGAQRDSPSCFSMDGAVRLSNAPEGLLLEFQADPPPTLGGQPETGRWGTVCAHGFATNGNAANIACRQLGYADGASRVSAGGQVLLVREAETAELVKPEEADYAAPRPSASLLGLTSRASVHLPWRACSGMEHRVADCPYRPFAINWLVPECSHAQDVVVRCQGERDPEAEHLERSMSAAAERIRDQSSTLYAVS